MTLSLCLNTAINGGIISICLILSLDPRRHAPNNKRALRASVRQLILTCAAYVDHRSLFLYIVHAIVKSRMLVLPLELLFASGLIGKITSRGYARGINPILTSFLSTLVGITKFLSSKTSEEQTLYFQNFYYTIALDNQQQTWYTELLKLFYLICQAISVVTSNSKLNEFYILSMHCFCKHLHVNHIILSNTKAPLQY
jgi:hypothetical protein